MSRNVNSLVTAEVGLGIVTSETRGAKSDIKGLESLTFEEWVWTDD